MATLRHFQFAVKSLKEILLSIASRFHSFTSQWELQRDIAGRCDNRITVLQGVQSCVYLFILMHRSCQYILMWQNCNSSNSKLACAGKYVQCDTHVCSIHVAKTSIINSVLLIISSSYFLLFIVIHLMYWGRCDLLCQINHPCDCNIMSSLYLTSIL